MAMMAWHSVVEEISSDLCPLIENFLYRHEEFFHSNISTCIKYGNLKKLIVLCNTTVISVFKVCLFIYFDKRFI